MAVVCVCVCVCARACVWDAGVRRCRARDATHTLPRGAPARRLGAGRPGRRGTCVAHRAPPWPGAGPRRARWGACARRRRALAWEQHVHELAVCDTRAQVFDFAVVEVEPAGGKRARGGGHGASAARCANGSQGPVRARGAKSPAGCRCSGTQLGCAARRRGDSLLVDPLDHVGPADVLGRRAVVHLQAVRRAAGSVGVRVRRSGAGRHGRGGRCPGAGWLSPGKKRCCSSSPAPNGRCSAWQGHEALRRPKGAAAPCSVHAQGVGGHRGSGGRRTGGG